MVIVFIQQFFGYFIWCLYTPFITPRCNASEMCISRTTWAPLLCNISMLNSTFTRACYAIDVQAPPAGALGTVDVFNAPLSFATHASEYVSGLAKAVAMSQPFLYLLTPGLLSLYLMFAHAAAAARGQRGSLADAVGWPGVLVRRGDDSV